MGPPAIKVDMENQPFVDHPFLEKPMSFPPLCSQAANVAIQQGESGPGFPKGSLRGPTWFQAIQKNMLVDLDQFR